MTFLEGKQFIMASIQPLYDKREASNIATFIIEWITGMNKTDQLINKSSLLAPEKKEQLAAIANKLSSGEPMQYVLGEAWFMGNRFKVNKDTLIPRPETEELVAWILEDLVQLSDEVISLIDIGTGSGCIPISLHLKKPKMNILAIDISKEAILIATENSRQLNSSIHFEVIDFLDASNWDKIKPVQLIVSNPPYIREIEKISMHQNVVNFEPHQALFVPNDDALLFYRKILQFSKSHLLPGGSIYIEINEAHGNEVVSLFCSSYESLELKKDIFGKDRMMRIKKPN